MVTIEFWGVAAIGGGSRRLHLPMSGPATVSQVLELAGQQLETPNLPEKLAETYMILVNGENIAYLQCQDTIVRPGDQISVVLPLAGG